MLKVVQCSKRYFAVTPQTPQSQNTAMRTGVYLSLCLLFVLLLVSCDKWFEYTPYSADVPEKMERTTAHNLSFLREKEAGMDPGSSFKIALISDSHLNFDDLHDAIDRISEEEDICFVIHGGDMTSGGMLSEYMIFWNIADKLDLPYFTTIGNHDCLANGEQIYTSMFGDPNYTFEFQQNKFIFFNDVNWELNNREPDYLWLNAELADAANFRNVFVITHIPPWTDQFTPLQSIVYRMLIRDAGVGISIHGHQHDPWFGDNYHDSTLYMVIGSVDKRGYYELNIEPDTFWIKHVSF